LFLSASQCLHCEEYSQQTHDDQSKSASYIPQNNIQNKNSLQCNKLALILHAAVMDTQVYYHLIVVSNLLKIMEEN
jgi:hypothetical protein